MTMRPISPLVLFKAKVSDGIAIWS
jgi:hypothetical protein